MPEHERRHNEVMGGSVRVVGIAPGREQDVVAAIAGFRGVPDHVGPEDLPLVILAKTSTVKAQEAAALLEAAGANVEVEDVWVTRDIAPDTRTRPTCPHCGSTKTQPFTFSGSGGRANMKCTACGQLFKERHA